MQRSGGKYVRGHARAGVEEGGGYGGNCGARPGLADDVFAGHFQTERAKHDVSVNDGGADSSTALQTYAESGVHFATELPTGHKRGLATPKVECIFR